MIETKDHQKVINYLNLKDPIGNLNIIGAIQNLKDLNIENPSERLVVFVNDREDIKCVIVREHDYWYYVYSESDAILEQVKIDFFDKLNEYGIDASDEKVFKILSKDRKLEWEEPCFLYYVDPTQFKVYESHLALEDVSLNELDEINNLYTYKDEYSKYFIEDSIKHRPSSLYKVDDEAVAWVLMHRDDSVGIMFVKEAFRKKGIAYELSMDILSKTIQTGRIPFIHIALWNKASVKLAEKCGFIYEKHVYWFGVDNK